MSDETSAAGPAGRRQGPPQGSSTPIPSLSALGPRFARFVESLQRPVVFFDIEATGTGPVADRIVEISIVRVSPPAHVEPPRTWRIDPGVRIPIEASEIHGIYNEHLQGAPTFAEVAEELEQLFAGADLAGFSIGRFDVRILHAEFVRAGRSLDFGQTRILDAQVIYHQREPRHLAAALQYYRGKELVDAHGAEADTLAALEVFAGQLDRYDDLALSVDELHAISSQHNDAYCDQSRRFSWRDNEPVFNFGRLRGKSLRWVASDPNERNYLRWVLDGNFEDDAKSIVREALGGRIRRRENSR